MTRTMSLLTHPAGPLIAVVVSAGLVLLQPGQAGTWVIGLSSLAWLNGALSMRRQWRTQSPASHGGLSSAADGTHPGIRIIAAMVIGTLVGGAATLGIGPLGVAAGGLIGAVAMVAIEFVQRRAATVPDRDRGETLREAVSIGVSVTAALLVWSLLPR